MTAGTGDELAAYHATIDGPKELIPVLDKLTRDLRGKIGESLKDVRAAPPLEQVTTSSLDALRKYADGARANDVEGDAHKAIPFLRDAVALDTTFAMAYRKLGVVLSNAGMPRDQVNEALTHAYRYRDRLPAASAISQPLRTSTTGPGVIGRGRQPPIAPCLPETRSTQWRSSISRRPWRQPAILYTLILCCA